MKEKTKKLKSEKISRVEAVFHRFGGCFTSTEGGKKDKKNDGSEEEE